MKTWFLNQRGKEGVNNSRLLGLSKQIGRQKKNSIKVITPLVLMTFFLYSIIPVQASDLKAPTTINNKVGKVRDYDKYSDELLKVLPQDTITTTPSLNNESSFATISNSTIPKSLTSLLKEYQLKIWNFIQRNNQQGLQEFLSNIYPILQEAIQNAYASQPFTTNSVIALFNNTNYLNLRRRIEEERKKKEMEAKEKFLAGKKGLKELLRKRLKAIKKRIARQNNSLTAITKSARRRLFSFKKQTAHLSVKIARLKRLMQTKVREISHLNSRSGIYLRNYRYYNNRYRQLKNRYRFRGSENKYKTYAKQRDIHFKKYRHYQRLTKQARRDYVNLRKQWQVLKNRQIILKRKEVLTKREISKAERNYWRLHRQQRRLKYQKLKALTRRLNLLRKTYQPNSWRIKNILAKIKKVSLSNGAFVENTLAFKKAKAKELLNYNKAEKRLNDNYKKVLKRIAKNYQTNLKKAEAYQEAIGSIKNTVIKQTEETITSHQGRISFKSVLAKWIKEETTRQKQLAEERVEKRKTLAGKIANTVFVGMTGGLKSFLNSFNNKLRQLAKELKRIKRKAKHLEEAYRENKAFKKKMKRALRKYKKYQKKYRKYKRKYRRKHKSKYKKRYKKYRNKMAHQWKKYLKYKKKYEKYGGLKKAYKSGYKQAKDVYRQFKKQYESLVKQRDDLNNSYREALKQATIIKTKILKEAKEEYILSKKKLAQAEIFSDYTSIGLDSQGTDKNLDLTSYLQLIPATTYSLGGLSALSFSSGIDALSKIKKSLKKLKKKAKKAYNKAVREALEKQRREEAERKRRIRTYYARLAAERKAEEEERLRMLLENTWIDACGNGYSGVGLSEEDGYRSLASILNGTAKPFANTYSYGGFSPYGGIAPFTRQRKNNSNTKAISNTFTPKKSWFGKLKDWGKSAWKGIKDLGKTTWKGIKDLGKTAWKGIKDLRKITWEGIKDWGKTAWRGIKTGTSSVWNGVKTGVGYLGQSIKELSRFTFNGIKTGFKSIAGIEKKWYNDIKSKVLFAGGVVVAPLVLSVLGRTIKLNARKYSNSENRSINDYLTLKPKGIFSFLGTVKDIFRDIWNSHVLNNTNEISLKNLILNHRHKQGIRGWLRERELNKKAKIISQKTGYSYEESRRILEKIGENSLLAKLVYNKGDLSEKEARKILLKDGFSEISKNELRIMGIEQDSLIDSQSGLEARVYINHQTKQIHIAFAGTEDAVKDGLTNLLQGLGEDTEQYGKVEDVAKYIKNNIINNPKSRYHNYTLTSSGHSLGGGEGSLFQAITGVFGINFNSAGLHKETLKRAGVTDTTFPNIVNVRTNNDVLTYFQEQADGSTIQNIKMLLAFAEDNQDFVGKVAGIFGQEDKIKEQMQTVLDIKRIVEGGDMEKLEILSDNVNIPLNALISLQKYWNNPNLKVNEVMPDAIGTQITIKKGFKDYAAQLYASFLDDIILNDSDNDLVENMVEIMHMLKQHSEINYYK